MKWFEGSIPEAIQAAKAERAVFVVFLSGDDDLSRQMKEVWQDQAVCDLCEKERCVGLSLETDSTGGKQFGEIYPVVCVPCTFFISNTGVPLEVVGGHVEPRELYRKIQNAVQMHNAMIDPAPASSPAGASDASVPPEVTSPPVTAPATTPTGAQPTPAIPELEAASVETPLASETPSSQAPQPSVDDRIQKAREIIDEKRRLKAKEEKEQEKEKERERRQLGSDLHRFKNMKAEVEAEELRQARLKEKQEEKAARDRVRKQIAADKADRIARSQREREERQRGSTTPAAAAAASAAAPAAAPAAAAATTSTAATADPARMLTARLQFRLPDGSAITHQFSSSATLGDARDFISPHASSMGRFSLSTTYPKRIFTDDDMSQSLLALNLAPSAVVVVIPRVGTASVAQTDSVFSTKFLMMVLAFPFITLWGFLCSFFGTQPQRRAAAYNQPPAQPSQPSASQPGPDRPSTSTGRSRPKSSYGVRRRQEGNIHRLSADDSDEDRTTWNGNSTQQM